jgi:hypothetical protein
LDVGQQMKNQKGSEKEGKRDNTENHGWMALMMLDAAQLVV